MAIHPLSRTLLSCLVISFCFEGFRFLAHSPALAGVTLGFYQLLVCRAFTSTWPFDLLSAGRLCGVVWGAAFAASFSLVSLTHSNCQRTINSIDSASCPSKHGSMAIIVNVCKPFMSLGVKNKRFLMFFLEKNADLINQL